MGQRHLGGATVVITGASSGIGEATAEAFARAGARLVLAARGEAALERVAARCRELGVPALAVPADVTDADAVRHLAERAVAFGGGIDIWVSNVGTGAVGRFHEVPMAAHEQVIRANLIGHMNDAHAVLPVFLRQGHGTFINMVSLGGFASTPFAAAYGASKFGLRGFTEALRGELADQPDIHICDVYPAFIDTPGLAHGANYTGRALSAPPPVYDARRVAETILSLARQPRDSAVVGSVVHLVRFGHALAPAWLARGMARFMERYFRRAPRSAVTDGSLYHAPAVAGGIDGGLRSPYRPSLAASVALLLVGGVFVAALLTGRDRRPRRPSSWASHLPRPWWRPAGGWW